MMGCCPHGANSGPLILLEPETNDFGPSLSRFQLVTDLVAEHLGVTCACMMGANIASEIAKYTSRLQRRKKDVSHAGKLCFSGEFCESTIGCSGGDADGEAFRAVFETDDFRVTVVPDVRTAEMCGALKNVVGVAAGMVDGMGLGNNTKAAVIRLGLVEMAGFIKYGAACFLDIFAADLLCVTRVIGHLLLLSIRII